MTGAEDKAAAEAREARAKADKAEQELAEWGSDLARKQRDAEARKATAVAEKEAAEARRARLTGLLPDLSKVDRGETTVEGEQPMFGSVLAAEAADRAGFTIKEEVGRVVKRPARILITTDPDLASSDAAYLDVSNGVEALIDAADEAMGAVAEEIADEEIADERFDKVLTLTGPVEAAMGAVAAAVPAVLSLFSAKRSLSTFAVTVDDVTATAAVAGKLADLDDVKVQLDDFRTVPQGPLAARVRALQDKRHDLFERKVTLDQERAKHARERAALDERIKALDATADEARAEGKQPAAETLDEIRKVTAARDEVAALEQTAATRLAVVQDVLDAVETFSTAVTGVPEGAKRSALTAACLREQLRGAGDEAFTDVLLIKATAGSATQLLDDRPLLFEDKLTVIAGMNVSWVLLDPATNYVKTAGTATATAKITGNVGGTIEISRS